MLPSFPKRSGAPLTDNEKLMIINVHNYLSKVNFSEESHLKFTLRNTFTPHKTLGQPKFQTDDDVSEFLRTKILNSNKTAEQVSTPVLFPNSVHIWDPRIKPPGNWRQKRSNAEKWNDVSDVIKDANIVLNQMDYHGNFNAEIFKDLFSTLCEILHEKYGLVNIHMDGASYHKRWVENIPTLSTKKQEIVANCSQYFLF
ncbi:unnamed protein product [Rhizophagus irregularis]|nr:unnamed protein product [Rhizophagus irregularis]